MTNRASTAATDGAFQVNLTDAFGFPVTVSAPVPAQPCGAGSTAGLVSGGTDVQLLSLSGGSLNANGTAGDSCTFTVDVSVPSSMEGGTYTLTSNAPSVTAGGTSVAGSPTSASFSINQGVNFGIAKSFAGSGSPGGTVTMNIILSAGADNAANLEGLSFTDDLNAMLSGATAGAYTSSVCGGTLSGTSNLSFSGGILAPCASCTISVPVNIPAGAALGTCTNTTSALTANGPAFGTTVQKPAASADLIVSGAELTIQFLGGPVIAGDTATVRYTIENLDTTNSISISNFFDNLGVMLSGLALTGPATSDTCGGTLSGTTFAFYVGGSVPAGSRCVVEAEVLVPGGAVDGTYTSQPTNLTTSAATSATKPGSLTVRSAALLLSKAFASGTATAGDTVSLEFTLENQADSAASMVGFTDDLSAMRAGTTFTSRVVL